MNNYYLNVDCSEKDEVVTIDGNEDGWIALKKILEDLKRFHSKNNPCIQLNALGGDNNILTVFNGSEYCTVTHVEIKLIKIKEETLYFHLDCNEKNQSVLIFVNNIGLTEFISSINSLIEYRGNFPTDINHITANWGGGNLTDDFPQQGFSSISHLRLYRWK